jgi:hypothetical protein
MMGLDSLAVLLAMVLWTAVLALTNALIFWVVRKRLKYRSVKIVFVMAQLVFVVYMIRLPLEDEIVGIPQFRELCEKGGHLKIDAERIKGKKVTIVYEEKGYLSNTAIPIRHTHYGLYDAETGEEYASQEIYYAGGGKLIHYFVSDDVKQIIYMLPTFLSSKNSCKQPASNALSDQYQFEIVDHE